MRALIEFVDSERRVALQWRARTSRRATGQIIRVDALSVGVSSPFRPGLTTHIYIARGEILFSIHGQVEPARQFSHRGIPAKFVDRRNCVCVFAK